MVANVSVSDWVAIAGAGMVAVMFVLLAVAHGTSRRDIVAFFFSDQPLGTGQAAFNLSATATSFAGVLLFFFLQTRLYGWVVLLVIFVALLGQCVFLRIVKGIEPSCQNTGSVFRFILTATHSPGIATVANVIVVLTFLAALLIELVIGSALFAYFMPEFPHANLAGMIILYSLVLGYVLLGGFGMVAFSDIWQFLLVALGLGVALVLVLSGFLRDGGSIGTILPVFGAPGSSVLVWGTFVLNAVIVNLALPTCQISSWQRFSATRDKKRFTRSVKYSLLMFGWVWLAAILLGAVMVAWQKPTSSISSLFATIRDLGVIGDILVFPLLFVGLTAALVSTADSLLISLFLGLQDFRKHVGHRPGDRTQKPVSRTVLILWGLGVLIAAVVLVELLEAAKGKTSFKVVQLMFAGYGQAILLFPVIFLSSRGVIPRSRSGAVWLISGLVIGFAVLWSLSIIGIVTEGLPWTHVAAIGGLVFASTGAWVGSQKASGVK